MYYRSLSCLTKSSKKHGIHNESRKNLVFICVYVWPHTSFWLQVCDMCNHRYKMVASDFPNFARRSTDSVRTSTGKLIVGAIKLVRNPIIYKSIILCIISNTKYYIICLTFENWLQPQQIECLRSMDLTCVIQILQPKQLSTNWRTLAYVFPVISYVHFSWHCL